MIGLVLGGGGAKGYAHIGVLKALDEAGIKPEIVVGTSMGSLVGGFYAAGYPVRRIEELALAIDKRKKNWLLPLRLSKQGFINGRRVVKYLSSFLGDRTIENLPVRYAATAVDVDAREEVVIDRGPLVDAIRASISIPVAFMPHRYAGRTLIDGGFPNPVPATVALRLGASRVIAVNVLETSPYPQVPFEIKRTTAGKRSMKRILETTMDIISSRLIELEMSRASRTFLVNVDTKGIAIAHFEKARPAIERGYAEAMRRMPEIRSFLGRAKS